MTTTTTTTLKNILTSSQSSWQTCSTHVKFISTAPESILVDLNAPNSLINVPLLNREKLGNRSVSAEQLKKATAKIYQKTHDSICLRVFRFRLVHNILQYNSCKIYQRRPCTGKKGYSRKRFILGRSFMLRGIRVFPSFSVFPSFLLEHSVLKV